MEFNFRIDNLELKSCGEHLLVDNKPHNTAEIVVWYPEKGTAQKFCCAIAYWVFSSDGYDLQFVGKRPFEPEINREIFLQLAEQGQKLLDKYYDN